jgi:hypothetical protein
MPSIHRRLPAALALTVALSVLAAPARTIAASGPTATGHSAPPPTFTVPASARVHGSSPTTTPASAAPNIATTPASGAPSTVTTTPAGAASPGATTTTPATAAPASTAPATGAPASTTPAVPAGSAATPAPGARHATTTKLSTGAIVVAALAALLILICLAWGAARWFAYQPRWSISLRHSLAEASWRLSASWDEFSDWARIGR